MPKSGELRIRLSSRYCVAIAKFLAAEAKRPYFETALSGSDYARQRQENCVRLSVTLTKAGARRRSGTGFVVLIDRELASFFASIPLPLCDDYRTIWRAQREFYRALSNKRGRQKLGGPKLKARAGAKFLDTRHRLRLRKRLRQDAQWDEWAARLEALGQTALTASIPPPKI